MSEIFEVVTRYSITCAALVVVGAGLARPIFKSTHEYLRSKLFIKILMWLPILGIFMVLVSDIEWLRYLLVSTLIILASREVSNHSQVSLAGRLVWLSVTISLVILATWPSDSSARVSLALVALMSVMSDVLAFFAGNYIGKHKLPGSLNMNKSWEGVIGQIVGPFVALLLIKLYISPNWNVSWTIPVAVGFASAAGDLLNSRAKRQMKLKDWSNYIPGHGGILDRMSSLSLALIVFRLTSL